MKRSVGIDIGSHTIKLVELEEKKGLLELKKYLSLPILDNDVKLTLKNIISLSQLSSKNVNISIANLTTANS